MEEIQGDSVRSEPGTPNATWWPLGFIGKLQAVSLLQKVEASTGRELSRDAAKAGSLSQAASQTLWSAGTFSGPIPNGFHSIILVETLAVQLTQREGELLHEKAEVKKLANFLKQLGTFWEDDLQSVVQMGFRQTQEATFSSQSFHGGSIINNESRRAPLNRTDENCDLYQDLEGGKKCCFSSRLRGPACSHYAIAYLFSHSPVSQSIIRKVGFCQFATRQIC